MKKGLLVFLFVFVLAACSQSDRVIVNSQAVSGSVTCSNYDLRDDGSFDLGDCRPDIEVPTPTSLPPEATETPTATLEPTSVIPTSTPLPTAVPDHDPLVWHEPTDHLHGVNPMEVAPDLAALFPMLDIPENGLRPETIKPELHRGDVWLYADASELGDGICDFTANAPAPGPNEGCIKRVLLRVHNVGHEPHSHIRYHTVTAVWEACTQDGSECGFGGGSALIDYGTAHCPYKKAFCSNEYEQPFLPLNLLPQSPYRTTTILNGRLPGSSGVHGFWAAQGLNPAVEPYYPEGTNSFIRPGWTITDGWQYLEEIGGEPKWVCDLIGEPPDCQYNSSSYQVFTFIILPPTVERPFNGFVHPNGTLAPECTEPNFECYRFFLSETHPALFKFSLQRQNLINNPDAAPIYEFDTGSGITRP